MVAARRLRKSYTGEVVNRINDNRINTKEEKREYNVSYNIKNKMLIKIFLSTLLLFCIVIAKFFYVDFLTNNILYKQYKNDYSKVDVVNKFEEFIPDNINSVIPSKIYIYLKNKYNYFKPYFINFNLRDFFNTKDMLLSVNKNVCDDNEFAYNRDDKMGIGGAEPITFIGEIKSDDNNIQYIRDCKLKLINPTNGVITSPFGERDEIWKGIETYHYGVDIGNKLNTDVLSSSDGIVCKVEKNNKYYGNFVIVQIKNITFKYAHLNKIFVKVGEKVKSGDKIGLMGNTGLSTGTHLHFEIRVKGIAVNPQDVVNI